MGGGAGGELVGKGGAVPGVERMAPGGRGGRAKETVGDLDRRVTGPGEAEALEKFVVHPRVHEVLGKGPNKASITFGLEGLQVDLRALATESYGAALLYFTGSKEHNIVLRSRAQKMGLTLNEYALSRLDDNAPVAGAPEEAMYRMLGRDWIAQDFG